MASVPSFAFSFTYVKEFSGCAPIIKHFCCCNFVVAIFDPLPFIARPDHVTHWVVTLPEHFFLFVYNEESSGVSEGTFSSGIRF
jgi:hypothetical protein